MNCRTAIDCALARRDAPLPAADETELQEHLSRCESCALEARQLDTALAWATDLPVAEPSEGFDWRLRLRLSKLEREPVDATPAPWRLQARWPLQFAGSAAAAAALVLALGWHFGESRSKLGHSTSSGSEIQVESPRPQFPPLPISRPASGLTTVSSGNFAPGPQPVATTPPLVPLVPADSGRVHLENAPAPRR
jgi:hypothetical protein